MKRDWSARGRRSHRNAQGGETYERHTRLWGAKGTQPCDNENNADKLHSRAALRLVDRENNE